MKLLIVEDQQNIAKALKKGFEQEHYIVSTASNGKVGLESALNDGYDVILLDLMLPILDGVTVCKRLREVGNQTPVLMLTAKGEVKDRILGLDAGADDYLPKPFSFEELLARVRSLVRRSKNETSVILKVDDLLVDTEEFVVTRGKTEITLSKKEFSLLAFLMRHKGAIISKDRIIENVWDYDQDVTLNTVEAFIKNLRKKIDAPFKQKKPLIHTVRGFGYKIE